MSEPRLILSGNAISGDPGKVVDYSCHWCDKRATDYLFMGPQFCDDHRSKALPAWLLEEERNDNLEGAR